jgi:2-polyprenyl-3-methyl-5-hydroxy-6-metoxy-1,4-benzoquinol methylase
MTLRRPPAARTAYARYRHLPRSTRAHIAVRWLSCPLPAVAAEVPSRGRVLDLGCGHGFLAHYLAADGPARSVHGVDVDGAKIAEARRAATAATVPTADSAPAPTFEQVDPGWCPPAGDRWDGIVVVDVLYLLGHDAALDLLGAAARAIAPGGRLVVKEIDTHPRWKHRLAVAQELAATRLAKVTEGATVAFLEPSAIAGAMHDAGLRVGERPIGRGYPHPHLLLVGDRVT